MEVKYSLNYEKDVVQVDIPKLGSNRGIIKHAIESKLTKYPEHFGKPLVGSLRNYRRLRIGAYRVIFKIQGTSVFIELISHRSKVYKEAVKRLIKKL